MLSQQRERGKEGKAGDMTSAGVWLQPSHGALWSKLQHGVDFTMTKRPCLCLCWALDGFGGGGRVGGYPWEKWFLLG